MTEEPGGAPGGDDPLLGAVLAGRYRLLEKLGEGGMGAVYRGVHETLRKPVAVKVLPRAARANREMVTRFEREAVAAANLKHPNIAEATDSGQMADGTLFMVMEFVEGRTLAAVMAQGRLAPGRALHLLRQIGAAVTFAHGREVVHRDLKPANVVVFDRGDERDLVKVIDFGIARMRSSFGGGTSGLTKAGSVVGTVEYMAPEQAMGQAVDARADQYALGVIAFEMLTGEPPYIADDVAALVFMHVGAPIPSVTSRAPELSGYRGLDEVVAKMMGKLPDERFPALSEAITALGSALEGRVTMAVPSVPVVSGSFTQPMAARPAVTGRGTIISVPPRLTQPNVLGAPPAPLVSASPIATGETPRPPVQPVAARRELPIFLIAVLAGLTGLAMLAALIISLVTASPTDLATVASASASVVPADAPPTSSMLGPVHPSIGGPGPHDKGHGKPHGKGK
jgi:eukaryotic-like serine/threonine-protein kinase